MEKKSKGSRAKRMDVEPVNITEEDAFKAYASMEHPSLNELEALLRSRTARDGTPIKVSKSWLTQKARKHDWKGKLALVKSLGKDVTEIKPEEILKALAREGQQMTADALRGLQARAISVIWQNLHDLKLTDPAQFKGMVTFIDRLNQQIQIFTGSRIGGDGPAPQPLGIINISEFKDRKPRK